MHSNQADDILATGTGSTVTEKRRESICNLVLKGHILVFIIDREGCGFVKYLFTSRRPSFYVTSAVHHRVLSFSFL